MHSTALIILNYNSANDTRNCIESVLKHNTAPIKFIIVDNASRPDEQDALKSALTEIFDSELAVNPDAQQPQSLGYATLITTDKNLGYARGNNVGLELANLDDSIENVLILNSDIIFVEDIIPSLINSLSQIDDCAIISPVLYKPDMESYDYNCARTNETVGNMIKKNFLHYWWKLRGKDINEVFPNRYILNHANAESRIIDIQLPSGSCMLIKKDLFNKIGLFDPHTFLYYEENILFKKIEKLKMKNYLCLDLRCIHIGAATTSKVSSSIFTIKESIKSQYYYAKKYSGCNTFSLLALKLSQVFFLTSTKIQKALKK